MQHEGPYSFPYALANLIEKRRKIWRKGWNGKNMFLFLMKDVSLAMIPGISEPVRHQDYVAMYTVDGTVVPWLCSQSDMLANDWQLVNEDYFLADVRNSTSPRFE